METVTLFDIWIYVLLTLIFLKLCLESRQTNLQKKGDIAFLVIYIFAILRYNIGYDYHAYWDIASNSSATAREEYEFLSNLVIEVSRFCSFPPLLFAIFSSISLCAYRKVLKSYSRFPALSWYFYFAYPLFFIQDCSTVRQSAAMGLFLLTYYLIDRGKFKYALASSVCAYLFHNTGLITIVLFALPFIKKVGIKVNIVIFIATFFAGRLVESLVLSYFSNYAIAQMFLSYVDRDMGGMNTFQYIMYAMNIVNFLFYKSHKKYDVKNLEFITLVNIGLCLYNLFQFESQSAIRLANYFVMFELLLLPAYYNFLTKYIKSRSVAILAIVFLLFSLQIVMIKTYIDAYNAKQIEYPAYVPYKLWLFNI